MMAKKKELSPEERLQEALVPEEEWPYEVPGNWCWIHVSSLASIISKGTTPKGGKTGYVNDGICFLRVENICEDGTISHEGIMHIDEEMHKGYLKRSVLQEGDILVSIAGTLGKTAIVRSIDLPMNTNQAVSFIRLNNKIINSWFVKMAFDNPVIQEHLLSQTKVTSIPNLTLEIIGKCPLPLPPLPEQHRIVARIESLFAKLDEAKEAAQAVVDGFEDRKAAILHKAFTGELTKEWREKNGIDVNSWELKKLKECGSWMGGGTPSMAHSEYWENGDILWITSKDMKSDVIENTLMRTNMLGIANSSANYCDKPSVLFVMRSGILRRTLPIAMVKQPYTVNQDLKSVIPDQIIVEYLYWVCVSKEKSILNTCMKNGTTVESINTSALMEFEVPIAPAEEQSIIIDIIVKMLQKESKAKDSAGSVIDQIDTMKKSILARAFRGELGTNDPGDESAVELVKRVMAATE